jgi:hypothetical protein
MGNKEWQAGKNRVEVSGSNAANLDGNIEASKNLRGDQREIHPGQ